MTTWRATGGATVAPPAGDYAPWHDAEFDRDVARDLLWHVGQWRHSGREVLSDRGGICDSAVLALATWRAVRRLRRIGIVIEGEWEGEADRGLKELIGDRELEELRRTRRGKGRRMSESVRIGSVVGAGSFPEGRRAGLTHTGESA